MRYLWYAMYGFVTTLAIYALFFRAAEPQPTPEPVPHHEPAPTPIAQPNLDADVQIALILDTSSSMDGLVAQARAQIWEMVAEMQVDPQGQDKTVAVAVYQYGNNRLSKREGYIQQLTPLTTDLDLVLLKLQTLRTSGGKEYAPLAIQRALEELQWTFDDGVERLIVIAGNEGFNQGPLAVSEAMKEAEEREIRVMPIYCANQGASRTAVSSWENAAELAGTDFESIDPDQRIAQADSPYDKLILEKYRKLEETRVFEAGSSGRARTREVEGYVTSASAVDRAVVNSRQAPSFDLVSQYKRGRRISSKALPQELRAKSAADQESYLKEQSQARESLQEEIEELNQLRREHLAKQGPALKPGSRGSLGSAFKRNARR